MLGSRSSRGSVPPGSGVILIVIQSPLDNAGACSTGMTAHLFIPDVGTERTVSYMMLLPYILSWNGPKLQTLIWGRRPVEAASGSPCEIRRGGRIGGLIRGLPGLLRTSTRGWRSKAGDPVEIRSWSGSPNRSYPDGCCHNPVRREPPSGVDRGCTDTGFESAKDSNDITSTRKQRFSRYN